MMLQNALDLFRRLGVRLELTSCPEFSAIYYRLARRYYRDVSPATPALTAAVNAVQIALLQSYPRWS
jgi:hypothetical protein